MRDEKENVLYQMHGFATDENNNYKFIGNKVTDRLKVWEFDHDLYKDTRNLDIGDTGVILATGTKDYINLLWDQSKVCMSDINEKDILYPRYGFRLFGETENSNSVADTLISCMQLKNRDIGLITPGRDVILIE
jgi:hypothetical protein